MSGTSVLLLVTAAAILAAMIVHLAFTRRRLRSLQGEAADMRRQVLELKRMEQSHQFVNQLIARLPSIAGRLYGRRAVREIPGVLIEVLDELFEPEESVVLLRRSSRQEDPERERQLIVAGASRGARSRLGEVISVGQGELGRVAELRMILGRKELSQDPIPRRPGEPMGDFVCDLGAPLEVGEHLLGVVAVAGRRRKGAYDRGALRTVAHLGAAALHNTRTLKQMKSVADLDPLTGVFNRRVLGYRLGEWIHRAECDNQPLAVFLLDIDHFKVYNDVNGHPAGDALLVDLARLVREQIRADDLFGRYGGEEFLLLMPDRSLDEAAAAAEKIRAAIAAHPFDLRDSQPLGKVSISGGVAVFPDHARHGVELLRAADRALYEAKSAGRDRVHLASPESEVPLGEPAAEAMRSADSSEPDDLQMIRGIGATFAERLAEAGITRYREIAALTWHDLQTLAERLGTVPERMVRDRWAGQARQLHLRKYGEKLGE